MSEDIEDEIQLEPLLYTIARLFFNEGASLEVAILADSSASLHCNRVFERDYGRDVGIYQLNLKIPYQVYSQIAQEVEIYEEKIFRKASALLKDHNDQLECVSITTDLSVTPDWRNNAKKLLAGDGVNNQGRVRSDNIASKSQDGLLFRSQEEIHFYKALKSLGVSFAPLPVFIQGGETYRRIEPDFVIIKSGVVLVVEIDGDTVHRETPSEAHDRTTMLEYEGVRIVRVSAKECRTQELANERAKEILKTIEKLKAAR